MKVILHGEVEVGQRHNRSNLYRSPVAAAAAVKMKPSQGAGRRPQRLLPPIALLFGILAASTGVGGVPTSVLASSKDSGNAGNNPEDGGGGGKVGSAPDIHQQSVTATATGSPDGRTHISVPQKRGVNPLLFNDFEYSGNSIPHGGQWDDEGLFDQGPLSAAALYPGHPMEGAGARMRNYDLLASLLGPPPQPEQTFYDGPVTPAVSFPYGYGGGVGGYGGLDRNKRMANFGHGKSQRQRSLSSSRMKRSPGKLSAADALSLLAILDSRDPYPPPVAGSLSDYFPSSSGLANGPNDVLPYSPTNQDIPLSLALAQLLAERNNVGGAGGGGGPLLSPYGVGGDLVGIGNGGNDDDGGQWMNSWTEPGVDYFPGFPMDVGAARMNGGGYGNGKPSKIGFTPQKRFMVSKRKRSVGNSQHEDHHYEENSDCTSGKKSCLLAGKVAASA